MVGRTIKVGRCSSGAACADTRISSAAWLALRDGIAEVCPGDSSPAVPVPSACGRSRSSGADSRFLRSTSPLRRGPLSPVSCYAGNHAAQQQQQHQRPANLTGSAVFPTGRQGRARRTSFILVWRGSQAQQPVAAPHFVKLLLLSICRQLRPCLANAPNQMLQQTQVGHAFKS